MGSELALLLEPVAVVAAGIQTGWKEITQGCPSTTSPPSLTHTDQKKVIKALL